MNRWIFSIPAFLILMINVMSCSMHHGLPPSDKDNGGLILPGGFEAVVVIDSIKGASRHIAVNTNGDLYVKLRFPSPSGGNAAIRDEDNDGKADVVEFFGDYLDKSSYGTAMRIHKGYLYFSSVTRIFRQKLTAGDLVPESDIELLLTDTQPPRQHDTKPIAFDKKGNMYIPFGAPSDCCQENDRTPFSPGKTPCPLLEHRAGIWKFDEAKPNQFQQDGKRYATGLRSIVALEWNDEDDNLFTVMHGRDYLHAGWSQYYDEWEGAVLPSEEFLRLKEGADAGWPYYYYDQVQGNKMMSPEYGGDGKKQGGGDSLTQPVIGFPGHFAPNDLLFYKGSQFPARYKNGAFIAFHGSTSSSPYPQVGYFIAFVPFKNGNPSGEWEVFADGFAGKDTIVNVSEAAYRPMGLSEGPDGSLYVAETEKGKIWRIMYKGDSAFGEKNLSAMVKRKSQAPNIKVPHPVKDHLDLDNSNKAAEGYNIYCAVCHQRDGKGDGRFPPLVGSEWVTGDPVVPINIILNGLEGNITVMGKSYNNRMPKLSLLTDENIAQIVSYIRQHFNNAGPVTPAEVASARKLAAKSDDE